MGGLFSSGKKKKKEEKKETIDDKDKAILELKRQRDRLKKYRESMEQVIGRETQIAKQLLKAGRKKQALLALKKKKYQETLFAKTDGQLSNIETMVMEIQNAVMNAEVFKALEQGKNALQRINDEMKIEDVEKLMEESAEAIAYQEEVSNALAGKLTADDDADVEKELADIEEADLASDVNALPEATKKIKTPETSEEKVSTKKVPAKAEVVLA